MDQRIAFRIAYEPADHLMLTVPRAIRPDRLAISLDGQRLTATAMRDRAGEPGDTVAMRVALPSPRIGRCEIQLRYAVRHEKPAGAAQTLVNVPLIIPGEGQVTANEVVVVPTPGLDVSYPSGPWSMESATSITAGSQTLTLSARRALPEVTLRLAFKERAAADAITIGRAWMQTRLTDARRQDRAVFRLTTNESKLQLTLPEGADASSLEVDVDARRIVADSVRQRDVNISLPSGRWAASICSSALLFRRPANAGFDRLWTRRKSSRPIGYGNSIGKSCSPLTSTSCSRQITIRASFAGLWNNLFWQRQPSLDQRDLESWIGAPPSGRYHAARRRSRR